MDNLIGMNIGEYGRMGLIPESFQAQNMKREWDEYNPFYAQSEEQVNPHNHNLFEKEDMFTLKIKVDRRTVAEGQFCGNYFPKYVRHFVDITGIIGDIISEITDYMSLEEYTIPYAESRV